MEQPDVVQGIWNLRDVFKAGGQTLVLVTPPGTTLPVELQNDVMVIDEPLSSTEDLSRLVGETFDSASIGAPDTTTVSKAVDLAALSSIGVGQVQVCRRPRVRLAITGNELLPAGSRPHGHCIADANGPMLAALVERDGGLVDFTSLVPDEHDAILDSLYTDADVVIVSGGSSVGVEDLAPAILARHGSMFEQEQFLHVLDRDEAERRFRAAIDAAPRGVESVPPEAALGHVLAPDAVSPVDVPSFDRSNVDGFAVVAGQHVRRVRGSSALLAVRRGDNSHRGCAAYRHPHCN